MKLDKFEKAYLKIIYEANESIHSQIIDNQRNLTDIETIKSIKSFLNNEIVNRIYKSDGWGLSSGSDFLVSTSERKVPATYLKGETLVEWDTEYASARVYKNEEQYLVWFRFTLKVYHGKYTQDDLNNFFLIKPTKFSSLEKLEKYLKDNLIQKIDEELGSWIEDYIPDYLTNKKTQLLDKVNDKNVSSKYLAEIASMNTYEVIHGIRNKILKNPKCPIEILKKYINDKDYVEDICQNPSLPSELISTISNNNNDDYISYLIINHPNCSNDVLLANMNKLLNGKDERFIRALLSNKKFEKYFTKIFTKLANAKDKWARKDVAEDKNVPKEILTKLADDEDCFVREKVAKNPNTPKEVLIKLSNDKDPDIRLCVARNANCPEDLSKNLLFDLSLLKDEHDIHELIAKMPNISKNILINLISGKPSNNTILNILENSNCSADICIKIALLYGSYSFKDPHVENHSYDYITILDLLKTKLNQVNISKEIFNKLIFETLNYDIKILAINLKNCPPEILTKLARSKSSSIRQYVAKNPNTPKETLIKLSDSKDYDTLINLAQNSSTTEEILIKLANAEESGVRIYVAQNPNCPREVLTKLANDKNSEVRKRVSANPNTPKEVLIKLVDSNDDGVRNYMAQLPNCPREVLTKLANDEINVIRVYVARNPNTPKEVLIKLSNDRDPWVRDTAQDILRNLN